MFGGSLCPLHDLLKYFRGMAFELKGTVKKVFDQQDFPSGFYKRDFVVTTEDQYPQDIKFSAAKERTETCASAKGTVCW